MTFGCHVYCDGSRLEAADEYGKKTPIKTNAFQPTKVLDNCSSCTVFPFILILIDLTE